MIGDRAHSIVRSRGCWLCVCSSGGALVYHEGGSHGAGFLVYNVLYQVEVLNSQTLKNNSAVQP